MEMKGGEAEKEGQEDKGWKKVYISHPPRKGGALKEEDKA